MDGKARKCRFDTNPIEGRQLAAGNWFEDGVHGVLHNSTAETHQQQNVFGRDAVVLFCNNLLILFKENCEGAKLLELMYVRPSLLPGFRSPNYAFPLPKVRSIRSPNYAFRLLKLRLAAPQTTFRSPNYGIRSSLSKIENL